MIPKYAWTMAWACLLVGSLAGEATAGVVTDQLKGAIDRVVEILDDPALKGEGRAAERRAVVKKVAADIFDFGEIARRSLARHWAPLTEKQREEFVSLFSELLERSYISRIESYGGEKILYADERMDGDMATVATRLVSKKGTLVPVEYRLLRKGDRWLVFDVNIEGVSLVSSYRTQFNKIIQTASYDELVQKLRTKQDELAVEDKGKKAAPAKK
jgi:phospholipid transport system substrate-binding protein